MIIFIAIFSTIIIKPLGDLDEIWNYNVASNIARGKVPYKDISTITTPLLPFINSIFLKVISDELIIMRILATVLGTAIIYMIYKILKELTKETDISMIITLSIAILFRDVYSIDYNYMLLFLVLCIIYIELKNVKLENERKKQFGIGIIAGLAICTKQSVGTILALIVVIYPLLKIHNKKEIKNSSINSMIRISGIIIPCIILIIYLLTTNSLNDFINYAIQGISTFDNKISYRELINSNEKEIAILAKFIPISIIITIITSIVTRIKKIEQSENVQLLTIYSLPMLILIYPISDKIHFLIGITIALISISYTIRIILQTFKPKLKKSILNKKEFIYKSIWVILIEFIIFQSIINYKKLYTKSEVNKTIEHYKYLEIPDYLKERIEQIGLYIKEKQKNNINVYIIDAEAAVYMIPLGRYTKNYDMFLKGNIGKNGEQGQIEHIQKEANEKIIYLVRKQEYPLNWQTPENVINYIKNNFTKIGGISIYDAYIIK